MITLFEQMFTKFRTVHVMLNLLQIVQVKFGIFRKRLSTTHLFCPAQTITPRTGSKAIAFGLTVSFASSTCSFVPSSRATLTVPRLASHQYMFSATQSMAKHVSQSSGMLSITSFWSSTNALWVPSLLILVT